MIARAMLKKIKYRYLNKEFLESVLRIDFTDFKFFTPLAVIAGIAMELLSDLPLRLSRLDFSSLIFDHLPLGTISVLFILQLIIVLLYKFVFRKGNWISNYFQDLISYIAFKLPHFTSPAFFVMLGLSFVTLAFGLAKTEAIYLKYAALFAFVSLFFIIVSVFAFGLKLMSEKELKEVPGEVVGVLCICVLAGIFITVVVDDRPVKVAFDYPKYMADRLERAAETQGLRVEDFVLQSVNGRISTVLDQPVHISTEKPPH